MDRYTKGFVIASLVYLVLASILGMWMGASGVPAWGRFAHVHLNLLGFMAMMVYGVGYFVLPRFNARQLRWPSWIPVHFYAANIGLLGMILTYPLIPSAAFVLFAVLSVFSVVLFAVNIAATIIGPAPHREEKEQEQPASLPVIDPDMRVGEILTRWPHVVDVLVTNGFQSLGDPAHQEQVKQMPVTLRMACQRHGVDVDKLVALLKEAVARQPAAGPGLVTISMGSKAGGLKRGERVKANHVLGDILAAYPETEKVFLKYYGSGCFSCPGQTTETVKQSALMHNVNVDELLEELNRTAGF
jgi:hybrid cluster-associated redox disulfide protein